MTFDKAIQIVQQYQKDWMLPGLVETLKQMGEHDGNELSYSDYRAYRVVMNQMSKLFKSGN